MMIEPHSRPVVHGVVALSLLEQIVGTIVIEIVLEIASHCRVHVGNSGSALRRLSRLLQL